MLFFNVGLGTPTRDVARRYVVAVILRGPCHGKNVGTEHLWESALEGSQLKPKLAKHNE